MSEEIYLCDRTSTDIQQAVRRASKLLEYMAIGGKVLHNNQTFVMDELGTILVESPFIRTSNGQVIEEGIKYLGCDMQVCSLLKLASRLTEEEYFNITSSLTLTKIKWEDARR